MEPDERFSRAVTALTTIRDRVTDLSWAIEVAREALADIASATPDQGQDPLDLDEPLARGPHKEER